MFFYLSPRIVSYRLYSCFRILLHNPLCNSATCYVYIHIMSALCRRSSFLAQHAASHKFIIVLDTTICSLFPISNITVCGNPHTFVFLPSPEPYVVAYLQLVSFIIHIISIGQLSLLCAQGENDCMAVN